MYKIVRHFFKGGKRTIETGLTFEEAQEHCKDAETSGIDWFDGYTKQF